MGKPSRDKGARRERQLVLLHTEAGIHAERVPLSGAARYRGNGADIDVYARGRDAAPIVAEVKARGGGEGFKTLERWLGENDALFLWRDRAAPLVVVPMAVWLELAGGRPPAPREITVDPAPLSAAAEELVRLARKLLDHGIELPEAFRIFAHKPDVCATTRAPDGRLLVQPPQRLLDALAALRAIEANLLVEQYGDNLRSEGVHHTPGDGVAR